MIRLAGLALLVLAACGSAPQADPTLALHLAGASVLSEAVTLTAADGVKIFATEYRPERPKATILLFHQAGSGKGEYATIAPRLAAAGYDALAVDQRSGGGLFGANETVKALGRSADYLDAQGDLQAAIDWARTQKRPIVLWGSSYSSSLVFLLAARNPDVKAVLAFSPGEYFDDKMLVQRAVRKLAVPVYVTVASGGEERRTADRRCGRARSSDLLRAARRRARFLDADRGKGPEGCGNELAASARLPAQGRALAGAPKRARSGMSGGNLARDRGFFLHVQQQPASGARCRARRLMMGELVDKIKGNINEAIGKVKQESDNPDTKAEGAAQEVEGKGQQVAGKVKGVLGDDI